MLVTRTNELNGVTYCEHCFGNIGYRCRDCDVVSEYSVSPEDREIEESYNVCPSCSSTHHCRCRACRRYMYNDDAYHANNREQAGEQYGPLCASCYRSYRRRPIDSKTFDLNPYSRTVGYEIEFFARSSHISEIQSAISDLGDFHSDGSIRPGFGEGMEFASYPANGDNLFRNIQIVTETLNKYAAGVNTSCGLHVHLHVAKMNNTQRANIRNWWCIFEPIFFSIVSPSRRDNEYSQSVVRLENRGDDEYDDDDRDEDRDEDGRTWQNTRYSALNLCALGEHGTYEVRLHQGTLNGEKIINWTRLLLEFFETFSKLELTYLRRQEVNRMSHRELMIFFFKQMNLPTMLRKYVISRYREFNNRGGGNAPYILLDKRAR